MSKTFRRLAIIASSASSGGRTNEFADGAEWAMTWTQAIIGMAQGIRDAQAMRALGELQRPRSRKSKTNAVDRDWQVFAARCVRSATRLDFVLDPEEPSICLMAHEASSSFAWQLANRDRLVATVSALMARGIACDRREMEHSTSVAIEGALVAAFPGQEFDVRVSIGDAGPGRHF